MRGFSRMGHSGRRPLTGRGAGYRTGFAPGRGIVGTPWGYAGYPAASYPYSGAMPSPAYGGNFPYGFNRGRVNFINNFGTGSGRGSSGGGGRRSSFYR